PVVLSEDGFDNQNMDGAGDPSGYQQQGGANTTGQMSGPFGNQSGENNQNYSNQQGGNSTADDNRQQYRYRYQRRYTIMDGTGNYTRLRSHCRDNATGEVFEIIFTIDTVPTLQLSYVPTLDATGSHHHFLLTIEQLIEYNDVNSNGKYDHTDVILSSLLMSNATFSDITYTNRTTPEGIPLTIIETHTLDHLFSIVIYLVSERTSFSNNTITQKEIKIDFVITDYPFTNQTSQLALITQVETPFNLTTQQNTYDEKQGTATQESGLNISSANRSGFFTWANNAMVDNKTYPVHVTVISNTEHTFNGNNQNTYTQTQVIFSYPRGENIVHDPKIGVIDVLAGILPSVLQFEYLSVVYLIACLVSAIVFYGIVYVRKNR
ncbi:MAG: hypothetical protein JXA75_01200, partial [Candidatus Thermoplasmatota archaeon]|nr:hypothetical protein [Candidatus Thermoplasmatota archaeon]